MPGILKCLKEKRNEIRLIGADADPNAPSRKEFDCFYQIPKANDPAYLQEVLKICESESVDLLVPIVTKELPVVAANRTEFENIQTKIAVMSPDKIRVSNNKGFLFQELEKAGIPVPPYRIVNNVEQLISAMNEIGLTGTGIVIKPVEGNGSRGVRLIDFNRSAFDAFFEEKPDGMHTSKEEVIRILSEKEPFPLPIMVMKLLPGNEYSVDMVAKKGEVLASVCRVGLTVVSSNQTSSMVVDEPEIIKMCEKAVKALGLSGNIGFDIKGDVANAQPYIIEINPRLTGGIVTCLAAGANMPWLGIKSWLGEEVHQPKLKYGVRMQRYWNERFFDTEDREIIM